MESSKFFLFYVQIGKQNIWARINYDSVMAIEVKLVSKQKVMCHPDILFARQSTDAKAQKKKLQGSVVKASWTWIYFEIINATSKHEVCIIRDI